MEDSALFPLVYGVLHSRRGATVSQFHFLTKYAMAASVEPSAPNRRGCL